MGIGYTIIDGSIDAFGVDSIAFIILVDGI